MEGFLASTLSLFRFGSIQHGVSLSRMETTGPENSVHTETGISIGEGVPPFSVVYRMILITSLECKRGVFHRIRRQIEGALHTLKRKPADPVPMGVDVKTGTGIAAHNENKKQPV